MFDFKNILYPINLDSKDVSPVVKALEIAKAAGARIHIVYVNGPEAGFRYASDGEDAIALRVKEVAPPELIEGQKITYAVAQGSLDREISEYCKKNSIDLIITGHKHRNKLYSQMFDTPDESIIDAIKLPVLVIPKK
jgi:nucleotide-binding universal stress UspA family protein